MEALGAALQAMVKRGPRLGGLKHRKERSMEYFAGLDVSVKETSVCVVDAEGRIVREGKAASEPEALLALLGAWSLPLKRIGLETGVLSQWLWSGLVEAGLPVICVETRRMHAVLKAHNAANKTDRNDARGIAQMMRVGLYRPVHVKTLRSQRIRMLLRQRKLLKAKALDVENELRATLRDFGLKVGVVSVGRFEARVRELVAGDDELAALIEPMLVVRQVLREQFAVLHKRLLVMAREDGVAQRLMTIPGVGAVVALGYVAAVDIPARFPRSKTVGAVFGLTPSQYQSGETQRQGRISRCGDADMRALLYEAAQVMLFRSQKWSWLKAWAMKVVQRRGAMKGIVALARRLAVIMHRIWVDGTTFRYAREADAAQS
jgi:transposase